MADGLGKIKSFAFSALALGPSPVDKWNIFWRQTKNVRVRLNLGQHHPDEIYSLPTRYGHLHFRDNFGDITNLANLFYEQVYRLQELAQPGVILDVGANIGLAAAWFAYHNPDREIFCFEPLPDNAAMIGRNCPEATVVQAAVGAQPGRVQLQVDAASVMASNIPTTWDTTADSFDVVALDQFVQTEGLDRIALLKIDAEGMEVEILRGAVVTLGRTAQVAMETHGRSRHDDVINILETAGFRIDDQEFDGHTGLVFASRAG